MTANFISSANGTACTCPTASGGAATQVLNLRDPDSDEDVAAPEQAQQQPGSSAQPPEDGACVLPAFQPVAAPKNKKMKDKEIGCAVCGDGFEYEK